MIPYHKLFSGDYLKRSLCWFIDNYDVPTDIRCGVFLVRAILYYTQNQYGNLVYVECADIQPNTKSDCSDVYLWDSRDNPRTQKRGPFTVHNECVDGNKVKAFILPTNCLSEKVEETLRQFEVMRGELRKAVGTVSLGLSTEESMVILLPPYPESIQYDDFAFDMPIIEFDKDIIASCSTDKLWLPIWLTLS